MTEPTVLRVLSGRLAGTEKTLPPSGTVSIGHQFWQDVVIRDPQTKGIAVDFALAADGQAQIVVLSGQAELLGQTVDAGQTAILPPYVPFSIGGVALAWGEPESSRWSDAGGLVRTTPGAVPASPSPIDEAVDNLRRGATKATSLFSGRAGLVALGVVGAIALGAAAVPALDALGLRADPATRVDRALDEAGLTQLVVAPAKVGEGVTVTGVVANEAQRVTAQEVLRDTSVEGTVDVQTSPELAQSAADVARGRGLQANAKATSRTGVELHTSPLTPEGRDQLVRAVRTDVKGIGALVVRDDLPALDESLIKTVGDLTKKISTVIAGDPSYIQTVDGARYFSGATMPSGHRLIGIEGDTVFLEKDGRQSQVKF